MYNALKQFINIKSQWPWVGYFLIFTITFIVFIYIVLPPGIIGPDSFYHTKMALMIKQNGLVQDFPWLQFTTYKDLFVDHHFLYHILLIPFLSIPTPENIDAFSAEINPLILAKLATCIFIALAFLLFYWFLRKHKTKAPMFFTLTMLLIPPFVARLSLIRAPAISIILLILGLYFILKKKYFLFFILCFIYVWSYGAWPLILIITLIYAFSSGLKSIIINKKSFKTFFALENIKLICSCVLGLGAGLIINPYFPKTIPFYWFQTVKIAILNYQNKIGVGAEWYSYNPFEFFIDILPILVIWIIAIAWFSVNIKQQKTRAWFLLFVSIFFMFYTWKAKRNVEYFIPTAVIFSSIMFTQIMSRIKWKNIKIQIANIFKTQENIFYYFLTLLFFVFASFFTGSYIKYSIKNLHTLYNEQKRPINHLQMASNWLKTNTEKNEIIFQSDWDIFPELFYFNTHNYYINGLDQTFMYEKNNELYNTWKDLIFNKTNPNKTGEIIKQKFNASYILVDKQKNKDFVKLLKKSKNIDKKYEDNEAIIYKINIQ